MLKRFLFLLMFGVCFPASILAQERPQQLLEEVVVVPDGLKGEWKIGDKTFETIEQTVIDDRFEIEPGSLAAVLFVEREGKNVALQIQPLPFKAVDLGDGPYVFCKDKTTAEVVTFFDGKVERKTYEDITEPLEIKGLASPEPIITLDPTPPMPARSAWEAPSKLMAISDLEGNYLPARMFLANAGVIDEEAHWAWGDGHLVLIGDLIDRGPQVTELMWMIRRLEREANAVGGQVHYVLGNHEAMVMAGDLRYIHPKYIFTSQRIGITYDRLFGESSDIGRWWRSKNAVITIGDLLFVHGGYSPQLDEAQLDMDVLNERIRSGLAPAIPTGDTASANPVAHQHGPFWYRGYFDEHAATWGKATPAEVQKILDRHNAKHIVIGHTVVPHVGPLDDTGQVIGIDVKWSDPTKSEGLLMEGGRLFQVDMNGKSTELKFNK